MAPSGEADNELSTYRLKARVREASSLAPVTNHELLARLDADSACWVVHDEELIRSAVSLLVVRDGHPSVAPVLLDLAKRRRGTDAESVFVRNGVVTVLGSAFVGGKGTIDPRRSFVASFDEADVRLETSKGARRAVVTGRAELMGMDLTAAINSALERSGVAIANQSKVARRAAKKAGLPGGAPINIEGAVALPDGATLLGLRYPVAVTGNPLMLRVEGDVASGLAAVEGAEVIEAKVMADPGQPAGIRDLAFVEGRVHMITAASEMSMMAGGVGRPATLHVSVAPDGTGPTIHRTFEPRSRIEGLARPTTTGGDGDGWWYVVDDRKAIVVLGDTPA